MAGERHEKAEILATFLIPIFKSHSTCEKVCEENYHNMESGGAGKKCHLEFKIPIRSTQRVSTPIVLLVICLDRMQMWRSIGPGAGEAIDLR